MKAIIALLFSSIITYGLFLENDNKKYINTMQNELSDDSFNNVNSLLGIPPGKGFIFSEKSLNPELVKFYMYTQQHMRTPIICNGNNILPLINTTKSTKVVIHGWLESRNRPWYNKIKHAYLKKEDYNVFLVDWSAKSQQVNYFDSATHTKEVGKIIADQIIKLQLDLDKVHVIGHSLGGQIAGFIGKYVKEQTSKLLWRISALDPARPLFENNKENDKLTAFDANVVDVIHTDGAYFGCINPVGTVDFYPNGGIRNQPGCQLLDNKLIDAIFSCSHIRSVDFFIESITSREFIAKKCDILQDFQEKNCHLNETAIMGEHVNTENIKGVFFLKTDKQEPFALGYQ